MAHSIAPQRFLQHFRFPRQSPSTEQRFEHTQGPVGLEEQNPGLTNSVK